jgi:hypothetical protein
MAKGDPNLMALLVYLPRATTDALFEVATHGWSDELRERARHHSTRYREVVRAEAAARLGREI